MDLIGKKFYSFKVEDYCYHSFAIFKDNADMTKIKMNSKIQEINNKIKETEDTVDKINLIGIIEDYKVFVNYDFAINTAKNKFDLHFRNFNVLFTIKDDNGELFHIMTKDFTRLNYKNNIISIFEGDIINNNSLDYYTTERLIGNQFNFNIYDTYGDVSMGFNYSGSILAKFNNKKYLNQYNKDVNPNIEKVRRIGWKIYCHMDFANLEKEYIINMLKERAKGYLLAVEEQKSKLLKMFGD